MSIATSLDKLSETLTNCKTNLKEKGVEADNIKISDVDEKIAEIQAGGGDKFANITSFKVDSTENVEWIHHWPYINSNIEIKTDVKIFNLHLLWIKDGGENEDPTEIVDIKLQRDSQDPNKWVGECTESITYPPWHSYTLLILGTKDSRTYEFEVLYVNGEYQQAE